METAITNWIESENMIDCIISNIDRSSSQMISDDEQDYKEFAKDLARAFELKEDLGFRSKFSNKSNASSNNNSFIEINSQIWDYKSSRRDDSLVFIKNFEKIKKDNRKNENIIKHKCSSANKIENLSHIKINNKRQNLQIENENIKFSYLKERLDSISFKKNMSNFKKFKNEKSLNLKSPSDSPVSSSTCWSTEFRYSYDNEISDENTKSPDNFSKLSCENSINNYFKVNYKNNVLTCFEDDNYIQTISSKNFQDNFNNFQISPQQHPFQPLSLPTPRKNPFDCLETNEIIIKGNKKQLDDAANRIKLENILRGKDKRTTLMIRNIPNKYSLKTIIEDLNVEFKGKFDVFYLPIDYVNKCNLGFAFINFVDSMHILQFYETFRGKKWIRFNSDKICELAYAKFQGKKELITHFEKGSIMNFEAEDKKPLILPTPSPLPPVEIPLKYFEAFITVYPYANIEILKTNFIINSYYSF